MEVKDLADFSSKMNDLRSKYSLESAPAMLTFTTLKQVSKKMASVARSAHVDEETNCPSESAEEFTDVPSEVSDNGDSESESNFPAECFQIFPKKVMEQMDERRYGQASSYTRGNARGFKFMKAELSNSDAELCPANRQRRVTKRAAVSIKSKGKRKHQPHERQIGDESEHFMAMVQKAVPVDKANLIPEAKAAIEAEWVKLEKKKA